jgi:hypothetical protein
MRGQIGFIPMLLSHIDGNCPAADFSMNRKENITVALSGQNAGENER